MYTTLPSTSARWRTGHCGESGFDFTVAAAAHSSRVGEAAGRGFRAHEVRDAVRRLREAGDAGLVEGRPDLLPQRGLGGERLAIAAGVRVVAPGSPGASVANHRAEPATKPEPFPPSGAA